MSEFEWRKNLRDLAGPVQPQRDLWLDIAARIEAQEATTIAAPRRSRWMGGLALAASVLVAVTAIVHFAPKVQSDQTQLTHIDAAQPALARADADIKALPNRDPRLVGAVIEVDSATKQLQQSLQQEPNAVFLVGLMNRNYERRLKLARLASS
jgi:hypothetical protein